VRNSILTRFPHRMDTSITDFVKFGIGRDVTGVDVVIPCLQSLFNVALVKTIFDPFAPGLDADINEQLLSMYSRISGNGMSFFSIPLALGTSNTTQNHGNDGHSGDLYLTQAAILIALTKSLRMMCQDHPQLLVHPPSTRKSGRGPRHTRRAPSTCQEHCF
jgi:hypothetical protein